MDFKFTGQGLFYTTGIILILTIVLAPVGIYFIYLGKTAYIRIEPDVFIYKMFTKKTIPFASIKKISVGTVTQGRYMVSSTVLTFVTVVPLIIEYGNRRKIKLSLNYFERPQKVAQILAEKTGKEITVPPELREYMQQNL